MIQVGSEVCTETEDVTEQDGWKRITGTRFVTGTVTEIRGDTVIIESGEERIVTLIDQCWLTNQRTQEQKEMEAISLRQWTEMADQHYATLDPDADCILPSFERPDDGYDEDLNIVGYPR